MTKKEEESFEKQPMTREFMRLWSELGFLIRRLPDDLLDKEAEFLEFVGENSLSIGARQFSPLSTPSAIEVLKILSKDGATHMLLLELRRLLAVFRLHPDCVAIDSFWDRADQMFTFPLGNNPRISFNGLMWRIDFSRVATDSGEVSKQSHGEGAVPIDDPGSGSVKYFHHTAIQKNPWVLCGALVECCDERDDQEEIRDDLRRLADEFAIKLREFDPDFSESVLRELKEWRQFVHLEFVDNALCQPFCELDFEAQLADPSDYGYDDDFELVDEEDDEEYDEEEYEGDGDDEEEGESSDPKASSHVNQVDDEVDVSQYYRSFDGGKFLPMARGIRSAKVWFHDGRKGISLIHRLPFEQYAKGDERSDGHPWSLYGYDWDTPYRRVSGISTGKQLFEALTSISSRIRSWYYEWRNHYAEQGGPVMSDEDLVIFELNLRQRWSEVIETLESRRPDLVEEFRNVLKEQSIPVD